MVQSVYKTYCMSVVKGVLDEAQAIATATSENGDVFIDLEQAGDNFPQEDNEYTRNLREALNLANAADCEYLHLF